MWNFIHDDKRFEADKSFSLFLKRFLKLSRYSSYLNDFS